MDYCSTPSTCDRLGCQYISPTRPPPVPPLATHVAMLTIANARLRTALAEKDAEIGRLRATVASPWDDKPLPEDAAIMATHPMNDPSPEAADRYGEAMRLVGARHGKHALVELVAWLLARAALQEPKP